MIESLNGAMAGKQKAGQLFTATSSGGNCYIPLAPAAT
jgi:hypothetical protein